MLKNYIDYWQDVKDATMITINLTKGKYPKDRWKRMLLISEHSPIRKIKFNWVWRDLMSWVSVHIVRHKFGIEHFVSTKRTDRTGVDRGKLPQDTLVNHEIELNAQSAINISQKRLCYQASKETREAWREFLEGIKDKEPEVYHVCVPSCIYRCGCPEITNCGFFDRFARQMIDVDDDAHDIDERYMWYHEYLKIIKKNIDFKI